MLMASKPAKILREEEEAMRAASKAMQLEKPVGEDEYQGPAVSCRLSLGRTSQLNFKCSFRADCFLRAT